MKITDGNMTIDISLLEWQGSDYGPDFAEDFFADARYDAERNMYIAKDVTACISQAEDYKAGRGDFADREPDEDLWICAEVIVYVLTTKYGQPTGKIETWKVQYDRLESFLKNQPYAYTNYAAALARAQD